MIAAVLLTLAIVGSLVVRLGLRPLDRMEATAGKIAAGDLSHRVSPANESTEVGRLGLALNAMLDRLEEAFRSARPARRACAASWPTPRTSCARRWPRSAATPSCSGWAPPPTPPRPRTRCAGSRKRPRAWGCWSRTCWRSPAWTAPPEHERELVHFSKLAADAVADARAVAPDRTITLEADPAACVVGDPLQLRQVLANLLRNALTHTPASSPVEVAVSEHDEAVTLSVRDHGPGLPTDSPEQLFERFWRSRGRTRARPRRRRARTRDHARGGGGARRLASAPARPAAAARSSSCACPPSGLRGRPRPRPPERDAGARAEGQPGIGERRRRGGRRDRPTGCSCCSGVSRRGRRAGRRAAGRGRCARCASSPTPRAA